MTVVGMDEECLRSIQESKTLAGIFQSVVDDCKVRTLAGWIFTTWPIFVWKLLKGKQTWINPFSCRVFIQQLMISFWKVPSLTTKFEQQVLRFLLFWRVFKVLHTRHPIQKVFFLLQNNLNSQINYQDLVVISVLAWWKYLSDKKPLKPSWGPSPG